MWQKKFRDKPPEQENPVGKAIGRRWSHFLANGALLLLMDVIIMTKSSKNNF
jgi:hypothetical protein